MQKAVQTVNLAWGDDQETQGRWLSERQVKPPKRVLVVNEAINAQVALHAALEGQVILWQGDYHQAKQLLDAMSRRLDANAARKKNKPEVPLPQRFHLHRQAQAQRARVVNAVLVPVGPDFRIQLRRAPDVSEVLTQAWGEPTFGEPVWISLREILGMIGAFEWRKKGVEVPALGARIFPFYGVFSPIRGEYVQLVAQAQLPAACFSAQGLAVEVGAGTGVLSALLAKRGVSRVIATELDARAVACAEFNIQQLGLGAQVEVKAESMFGGVQADLVVCNPPWLPAKPSSAIEAALYDENHHMLKTFLQGLPSHLRTNGEGWLILSDLAEHLGLRQPGQLEQWIQHAGLEVVERLQVRPQHRKVFDVQDPLHAARQQEVTSLWRLRCAGVLAG